MKYIFLGGKIIGNYILENLLKQNYVPEGVITYRDELSTKLIAKANKKGSKILKISRFKDEQCNITNIVKELNIKVLISAGFPFIISEEILNLVVYPINIHTSDLPKYRGYHPISAALLNDEPYQATTVHLMIPQVDAGPVLLQDHIRISNEDTIVTIRNKLIKLSFKLLVKVLDQIRNKTIYTYNQRGEEIWAPKRTPSDSKLNFNNRSRYLHNFIRAHVNPYPNAFIFKDNEKILIKRSIVSNTPGIVLAKIKSNKYIISTNDGVIYIETDKSLRVGDKLI